MAVCRNTGPGLDLKQVAASLVMSGVTLEPKRIAGLDELDRQEWLPPSVHSQIGNMMLDTMGFDACDRRRRLGAEAVIARLQEQLRS